MTKFSEQLETAAQSLMSWVAVSLAAGFVWMVRRILTNERKIEILETYIEHRDKQREEDRDMMREIGRKVDALYSRNVK
jgi:hypothetical protein